MSKFKENITNTQVVIINEISSFFDWSVNISTKQATILSKDTPKPKYGLYSIIINAAKCIFKYKVIANLFLYPVFNR